MTRSCQGTPESRGRCSLGQIAYIMTRKLAIYAGIRKQRVPSIIISPHRQETPKPPTSWLRNECVWLLMSGNKITTCFVFSWPGLMLASAAPHLFISSCAVAIYPAASADNSTISHQQQWEGGRGRGFGSTLYTQSTAQHCFP